MSREEAVVEVFREYSSEWNNSEEAAADVLAAADAHDAAHGIHRVSLDDATVERAAEQFYMGNSAFDKHWDDIGRQRQEYFRKRARAVLAAAVEVGQ